MQDFMKKQRLLVTIPMVLIVIYSVFYLIVSVSDSMLEHHHLFLLSILLILSANFLYFAFVQNSYLMKIGGILIVSVTLLEVIIGLFFSSQQENFLYLYVDSIIHSFNIAGILFVSYGLYLSMVESRKRHMIFHVFFNYNNAVFFELDKVRSKASVMFSQAFMRSSGVQKPVLQVSLKNALNFLDEDYHEAFKRYLLREQINPDEEIRLKVKIPNEEGYRWMFCKRAFQYGDMVAAILIDISNVESLIKEIDFRKEAYEQKEHEEKTILENTNDIIVKFRYDGKIMFATENYGKFFNYSKDELMKMSVENLDEITQFSTDPWFIEVQQDGYSESIVEWNTEGKTKWIYWKNRALYDDEGKLEAILSVGHDITDLKRLNNELYQKSLRDDLTNFYNRNGLFEQIQAIEGKQAAVLFYLSLDIYSYINDYYGHEVGDQLIRDVASELRYFEHRGAIVGRISRDEFVLLAHEPAIIQDCLLQVYRFLESSFSIAGTNLTVKKHIGYAIYPDDAKSVKALMSLASLAMLESKNNYTHTALRYREEFQKNVEENLMMASEIRKAIQNNEIDVHFQPVIQNVNRQILTLEALARWTKANGQIVSPITLFQHATKSKLVEEVDRYLIDKALLYFKQLRTQPAYLKSTVSINLTPETLLDSKTTEFFKYELSKYAINPDAVVIEIAENTFVGNLDHVYDQIRKLRQIGMKIAIDDFGREYSSLSVLTTIDFDFIKIDRFFVDRIAEAVNQEIIQMVLRIAKDKSKVVVAEGVETMEQAQALVKLGCVYHQGYYYAKPKKLI